MTRANMIAKLRELEAYIAQRGLVPSGRRHSLLLQIASALEQEQRELVRVRDGLIKDADRADLDDGLNGSRTLRDAADVLSKWIGDAK